jgi:hypothetical protein
MTLCRANACGTPHLLIADAMWYNNQSADDAFYRLLMPTITIDIPDSLNIPPDWNAQMFVLEKMYEAGFIPSDQAPQTDKDCIPANAALESWFTPEEHAQFRENRRRLEEKFNSPQTQREQEELYQLLLNGPVADEEEIQTLEEIQRMRRQWKLPW